MRQRVQEAGELFAEEGEDVCVCDLFELEGMLQVGLEQRVHLRVQKHLLHYLVYQYLLYLRLHLLSALSQQSLPRLFFCLRPNGLLYGYLDRGGRFAVTER